MNFNTSQGGQTDLKEIKKNKKTKNKKMYTKKKGCISHSVPGKRTAHMSCACVHDSLISRRPERYDRRRTCYNRVGRRRLISLDMK